MAKCYSAAIFKTTLICIFLISTGVHASEPKGDLECEQVLPAKELIPLEQTKRAYQQLMVRLASTPTSSGASLAQKILRRNLESQLLAMGLSRTEIAELANYSFAAPEQAEPAKLVESVLYEEKWDVPESTARGPPQQLEVYQPLAPVEPSASLAEIMAATAVYQRLGPIDKEALLATVGHAGMPVKLRSDCLIRVLTDGFHGRDIDTDAFRDLLQDPNGQLVLKLVGDFHRSRHFEAWPPTFNLPARHHYRDLSSATFNWQSADQFVLKTSAEKAAVLHRFYSAYETVPLAYLHSHLLGDLVIKEIAQQLNRQEIINLIDQRQQEAENDPELYAGEVQAADIVNSSYEQRFLVADGKQSIKVYLQTLLKQHLREQIEKSPHRRHIMPFLARHQFDLEQVANWLADRELSPSQQTDRIKIVLNLLRFVPFFSGPLKSRCNLRLQYAIHAQLALSPSFTTGTLAWVEKFWRTDTESLQGGARLVFVSDHDSFKMQVWRFKTKGLLEVRVQKADEHIIHRFEAVESIDKEFWNLRELWRYQRSMRSFDGSEGFATVYFRKLTGDQQKLFRSHQNLNQAVVQLKLAYPTASPREMTPDRFSDGEIKLQ